MTGIVAQPPGIDDFAVQGRGCGGFRAHEIDLIIFGAAAAGKVAGEGAQTVGVRGRGLPHADAAQAAGLMNPGAGLDQGQQAAGYGHIFQDLAGAGVNFQADQGMDFSAGQNLAHHHQISIGRIAAGADGHLLHRQPLHFADVLDVVRRRRAGDLGGQ